MISTVIVAHTARERRANALAALVDADEILIDDGTLGPAGNHRRAWDWHTANTDHGWALVLEDDAVPVLNFDTQLYAALTFAPADIVSLYLGRARPPHWQGRIQEATGQADHIGAAWLLGSHLLHAVAVAARSHLAPTMADWTRYLAEPVDSRPVPRQNIQCGETTHHPVAYTWPSLVDHADGPTVADHADLSRRRQGRVAWRTGTRTNWCSGVVPLGDTH